MEKAGQKRAVPRPVRVCRICVDPLQSPAAVEPCGHVFCHACIQPRAAPNASATCPTCHGPIGGIRVLPEEENRAEAAPRRRRRLHPFVVRWRQRKQREQEEEAAPGGRRRRTFADGDRAPSPRRLQQRVQRVLEELGRYRLGQEGRQGSGGEELVSGPRAPPLLDAV